MKHETWKVALACAIGAAVGSLVALEVSGMFWWIGLMVGGVIGYVGYDVRTFAVAIPAAYRAARGWQAPPLFWRHLGWFMLAFSCIMIWLCPLSLLLLLIPDPRLAVGLGVGLSLIEVCGVLFFMVDMDLAFPDPHCQDWDEYHRRRMMGDIEDLKEAIFVSAPPIVIFWHLPRGVWWVARRIPRGIAAFLRFMGRFFWKLFLLVHSEMRLLCGVDAALGALLGYVAGSAAIGAAAGGLFGLVNYVLITEKWLRPKGFLPSRSN